MKKILILILLKFGFIYSVNCQSRFEIIRFNNINYEYSISASIFDCDTNDSLKLSDI